MSLLLDLTPALRGPQTGIGLAAWGAAQALRQHLGEEVLWVSRQRGSLAPGFSPWTSVSRLWGGSNVVHTFDHTMPVAWTSSKVLTLHDAWTLEPNPYQSEVFRARKAPRLKRALERADVVLVPSQHVLSHLQRLDAEWAAKARVLAWGPTLSLQVQDPATPKGADPRVASLLSSSRPFVLSLGMIEARKNPLLAAQALQSLEEVDLVLVGGLGHQGEELLRHLQDFPRVHYLGVLSRKLLQDLLGACLALVQSSWDEGFGLPVLEALSAHKPVLLSSIPTFLEVAGTAGLYFDPRHGEEELRAHVVKLLKDENFRCERSQASATQALRFTWENYAKGAQQVYAELG